MIPAGFPVDRYLERIGVAGPVPVDLEGLTRVHGRQLRSIPFENLDILMGRGVSVELDAIVGKLVDRRRGGYCFECNTLLAAGLRALGFDARLMLGRVMIHQTRVPPRTHAMVRVELDDGPWLADAGFGGFDPRRPIALEDGATIDDAGSRWRLERDERFGWRLLGAKVGLDAAGPDGTAPEWQPLYVLDEGIVHDVDVELANHYTATAPASRFRSQIRVARHLDDGRLTLGAGRLTRRDAAGSTVTELDSPDALLTAIRGPIGIPLDPTPAELEAVWSVDRGS